MDLSEQLIDTWHIHNRINLYLLDAVSNDALDGVSLSGGRSVKMIFAHMHSIRLQWMEAVAPDIHATQTKIPARSNADKAAITADLLRERLTQSGEAVAKVLTAAFERGKLPNYKPHPGAFLGYLISHESYHRGEIGIVLTQSGHPLPDDISYGMWDWDKR